MFVIKKSGSAFSSVCFDTWAYYHISDLRFIQTFSKKTILRVIRAFVCAWSSLCVPCRWECSCVFPKRAPVRAVTAYLQKHLTGLGGCSVENIPKPLVGVNTLGAFHTPTSLSWNHILSRGLLHNLNNKIYSFDQIILFIHTFRCVGVLLRGDACREISHSSQSELLLYKHGWQNEEHTVFNETACGCR